MPKKHHPKRGSKGYSPRKRAKSQTPQISNWPKGGDKPKIQGFMGYKAGMTHAFVVDYRPTSTTSGKEVRMPVTVVEAAPVKVAAIRGYKETGYGLKTVGEKWAENLDSELKRKLPIPKKPAEKKWDFTENIDEIRAIIYTQPYLLTGVPKKTPDIMEFRIGGGSLEERINYAKEILGKEIKINDTVREGDMLDTAAVTKGKGFQGHVKRWGVKLLSHKNSKHRRMVGNEGSWHPNWVQATVPQAGQTGGHQRTELNKRVLKITENGEEITPEGGFKHYGVIRNPSLLFHGSLPGPSKRLIAMRDAIRYKRGVKVEKPEVTYISTTSKQGV